jgi:hypothetical protein
MTTSNGGVKVLLLEIHAHAYLLHIALVTKRRCLIR